MTRSDSIYFSAPLLRAADADREDSLRQLRGHWLAGRLTLEEYEERCAEATEARYLADLAAAVRELPPPAPAPAVVAVPASSAQRSGAVAALALGITGLVLLLCSMGLLFIVSLPLSVSAWALGRSGRRREPEGARPSAAAGEVLGIVGTVLSCLALTACALVVA